MVRKFRTARVVLLALAFTATVVACGTGNMEANVPPAIGTPTGPGTVGGTTPDYATTINLGDPLTFAVTATDSNSGDAVDFTAAVTGGSLTAAQAGFTTFPSTTTGISPQSLIYFGTAAVGGDIEISFSVEDLRGAADAITHTITISVAPQIAAPTGPGTAWGMDPTYTALINLGDSLDFSVMSTDANTADTLTFTALVTGGSLTETQAGFTNFPSITTGTSPQTLTYVGTSALAGDIEISFSVEDPRGARATITHTITINAATQIGPPTGPGTVRGTHPTYTTLVNLGDSLDFGMTATDVNMTDTLNFTASVTGGSLTEAWAGFTTFPSMTTGASPQILSFAGTAAYEGDIEITFHVDDGKGSMDTITHTITINSTPRIGTPTGPGAVREGWSPTSSTVINPGDSLDFSVMATDANAVDTLTFTASVTGGSLTETQAGFTTFPSMTTGASPQSLSFSGAAAREGNIEITFLVDDGKGAMDTITHTVHVLPPSPVRAWGNNHQGQLGDATATNRSGAVQVFDPLDPMVFLTGGTVVAAGFYHTVALLGDGTLRTWGYNEFGQLGHGTTTNTLTPVPVVDPFDPTGLLSGVTGVAAGIYHTAALLGDGTVRSWGHNSSGQLGDGTIAHSLVPVQVVDRSDPTGFLTSVSAVAVGWHQTVALLGDGTVRAWGYNYYGVLGDGTITDSFTPVQVVDPSDPTGFLTGVTAVAAGATHTVALLGDGTLRAWGYNYYGMLGDGTITDSFTPVQVVDPSDSTGLLTGVTAVAALGLHTVALLGDGTVRAWGHNLYGQLGDGTTVDVRTPVQVVDPSDPTAFLTRVTAVAAGCYFTVALLGDDTVRGWGYNEYGQLGDGTFTDRSTPVRVVDPSDPTGLLIGVRSIAAGHSHAVAAR
ncbi:MAG: hypothetical protein O7H41_01680 [Planctomycetota bacterium]|nr:hypothetical protein [Planctomycetota bacterium]